MADIAHDASGPSPKPGDVAPQQASRPDSPEGDELRVFVSYSRDDLRFAGQLVAALNACGFECFIDREGISGGEKWKQRIGNLISEADTVVFMLSPASARSEICAWEVEEAARLGKRIGTAAVGQQTGCCHAMILLMSRNGSALTRRARICSRPIRSNAASISPVLLAGSARSCRPSARAAAWASGSWFAAADAKRGFQRKPMVAAFGTSSCSNPSRLASSRSVRMLMPVMFPPGRWKLSTRPALTGSLPMTNTIGIVEVAALAASGEGSPPPATSTFTCWRTRSAAIVASRSYWPAAQRYSILTLRPSTKPACSRPLRKAE